MARLEKTLSDLSLAPQDNMPTPKGRICPKCSYERKPTDSAPAWECPRCGVVYDKAVKKRDDDDEPPAEVKKSSPLLAIICLALALGSVAIWWATRPATKPAAAEQAEIAKRQETIAQSVASTAQDQEQTALENSANSGGTDNPAIAKLEAKANRGHTRSMVAMGSGLLAGRYGKRDVGAAKEWLGKAAALGDPIAYVVLGSVAEQAYEPGAEPNYEEAANWYRRAARAGHPSGMIGLGALHAAGVRGVTEDRVLGMTLLLIGKKAAPPEGTQDWLIPSRLQSFWASSFVREAEKKMTQVEIVKARDAAEAWQPGQTLPQ